MARNTSPIAKKCKALDISPAVLGYSNKKTTRNPGGDRRKKVSEYGSQMKEKQKVKFVYGVLERQFRRYYERAVGMRGVTGDNLNEILIFNLGDVLVRNSEGNMELPPLAHNVTKLRRRKVLELIDIDKEITALLFGDLRPLIGRHPHERQQQRSKK